MFSFVWWRLCLMLCGRTTDMKVFISSFKKMPSQKKSNWDGNIYSNKFTFMEVCFPRSCGFVQFKGRRDKCNYTQPHGSYRAMLIIIFHSFYSWNGFAFLFFRFSSNLHPPTSTRDWYAKRNLCQTLFYKNFLQKRTNEFMSSLHLTFASFSFILLGILGWMCRDKFLWCELFFSFLTSRCRSCVKNPWWFLHRTKVCRNVMRIVPTG